MDIFRYSIMRAKLRLKEKSIELRKQGLSYSEIKERVPVSKSTLSLWLRNIDLTGKQKQRLRELVKTGQPNAALAQKRLRIERTREIINKAKNEIGKINDKELLYIGAMLYWAEGSKQKKHNPSQRVVFSNSDPIMIKLFLKWIKKVLHVEDDDLDFEIYSHENFRSNERKMVKYWALATGLPERAFNKIYFKKDKRKNFRKNKGKNYNGLLRVKVRRSTDLNRRIAGWIEGVCIHCGVV